MASPEWQAFRQTLFPKDKKARCHCCNRARNHLEAHHLTYANFGRERPGDVVLVCRVCHDIIHRHFSNATSIRHATELTCDLRRARKGMPKGAYKHRPWLKSNQGKAPPRGSDVRTSTKNQPTQT